MRKHRIKVPILENDILIVGVKSKQRTFNLAVNGTCPNASSMEDLKGWFVNNTIPIDVYGVMIMPWSQW